MELAIIWAKSWSVTQNGQLSLESGVVLRRMLCPKVHGLTLPIKNRPGNQWVGDDGGRFVGGLKSPEEVEDAEEQDGVGIRVSNWQAEQSGAESVLILLASAHIEMRGGSLRADCYSVR